jgi:hypothetical protein
MFVVLVGGYTHHREAFYDETADLLGDKIVWVNDRSAFYYVADLFVNFGGIINIPKEKKVITWSGDNQETIARVYKTLGLE